MNTLRAASVVIHDGRGSVLLARRSDSKTVGGGLWETIGGSLEPHETPEQCVRREVHEELGCNLGELTLLGDYRWHGENMLLISTVFAAGVVGQPAINAHDHSELRWVSRSEALELDYAVDCRRRVEDFFAQHRL